MKQQFVHNYYAYAKEAERQTGIPARFGLAQSALETGWGKTIKGNMLFGMKVGSGRSYGGWQGHTQLIRTTEYASVPSKRYPVILSGFPKQQADGTWKYRVLDEFRAYPSPLLSFIDWAGLLKANPRYQRAFRHTTNPYLFADEIAKAGYATDPNYAFKISQLIAEIEQQLPQATDRTSYSINTQLIPVIALGTLLSTLAILRLTKTRK